MAENKYEGMVVVRPGAACIQTLYRSHAKLIKLGGAPFSGKTLVVQCVTDLLFEVADRVSNHTAIVNVEYEIARQIKMGGSTGRELSKYEKSRLMGQPIPDQLMAGVMLEAIHREASVMALAPYNEEPRGIILDDYPLNHTQEVFLHTLKMPWSAVCITIPKVLYKRRLAETGRKNQGDTVATEKKWHVWENVTLPAFRQMERSHHPVKWVDGSQPLKEKVKAVLQCLKLDKKQYNYLCNCLNDDKHPATAKIITAENKDEHIEPFHKTTVQTKIGTIGWDGRHLGINIPRTEQLGTYVPACTRKVDVS